MMARALITGVGGQDSFYLSELLKEKGYDVFGLVRRTAQPKMLPADIEIVEGDVTDSPFITKLIYDNVFDEVYHLAAQSHVGHSFEIPSATFHTNALGTLNLLEAIRLYDPETKFYNAATSELFGLAMPPQNETTPFYPRSPYAVAKLAAFWLTKNYREAYNLFACNGILFNHESEVRGPDFVTQKIATAVARIKLGLQQELLLGNLDAIRDWGHAADFVEGMWLMLQASDADDYVLATGQTHTVRDFLDVACEVANMGDWQEFVKVDEKFIRPTEVPLLRGDASKARLKLGWKPMVTFEELVSEMVMSAIESESNALRPTQ